MRISVVIPCYNGERYLAETLASVFAQSLQPFEVLVVDDGSTDDSVAVAEKAGATVIRCPVNRGEPMARNTGIIEASGDWIAMLDADDLWLPHHLETMVGLIEAHPDASMVWGRCELFGDLHHLTRLTIPENETCDAFLHAARANLAQPSSSVFRRDAALGIGGFDPAFRVGDDFDFWLRFTRDNAVACTYEVTARYRIHANGISRRRRSVALECQCRSRLRMFASLEPQRDAERRAAVEQIIPEAWELLVASAWMNADRAEFDDVLAMWKYVPGSEPSVRRWSRCRPFFGMRRYWNELPDPVRGGVKRLLGRSTAPA